MVFAGGYLTVARVRGVAVRLHFTVPLGLIFFMAVLRNAALVAGVAGIVVAHELGHVALARKYRLPVVSIDVTGIGGACRYVNAHATETQEAIIAWGGVLVQGCFLAAGEIAARTIGLSETLLGLHVINFVIMVNVAVIIETIFAWPGIGRLLFEGISLRDFPIVQGVVVMAGVMIIGVNLLIDVLYAIIDPRIRYS